MSCDRLPVSKYLTTLRSHYEPLLCFRNYIITASTFHRRKTNFAMQVFSFAVYLAARTIWSPPWSGKER
jgi:hypothetical protein